MNTLDPAVPPAPAAVTIDDLSDAATIGAGIDLVSHDAMTLQSLPLQARRVIVRLGAVMVVFYTSNLRVRTRTQMREDLLAYVTFGPQTRGTVNGLPVRSGMMLAAAPRSEAAFVVEPGWEGMSFLVSPQVIGEHLAIRQRDHDFQLPQGVEALQVSEARAQQLFDWGRRLLDTAVRDPALFNDREAERTAAQAELIETLLAALDTAKDLEPSRSDRTRQAQSLVVKTAEAYAVSKAGASLYVTDLCQATGVSQRTLEYAFKEVMGLTPMAYLVRLRLHRVRQALLAAPCASTTVSAEALKWGFWHFGEFSRAYKACFGEPPSDTLRQNSAALANRPRGE